MREPLARLAALASAFVDEDEEPAASPGAERRLAIVVVTTVVLGILARFANFVGAPWLMILSLAALVVVFTVFTVLEARAQQKTVPQFLGTTNRRIIRQIRRRFGKSSP